MPTFLVTCTATTESGEVTDTITVVGALDTVEAVEQRVIILGRPVTIRFSFDPPLIAPPPAA